MRQQDQWPLGKPVAFEHPTTTSLTLVGGPRRSDLPCSILRVELKLDPMKKLFVWIFLLFWFAAHEPLIAQKDLYGIRVVDAQTKRGVPLIELKTVHHVSFWTDSLGYVAVDEPGWFGREIYFQVKGDGYEMAADGFGYAGVRLRPEPGRIDEIVVRRTQVAERLYRITGADQSRDAKLLGRVSSGEKTLHHGNVVGQDSAQAVIYSNRIYWFWGDTSIFRYPLGNFRTSGAYSLIPGQGGLSPSLGIELNYFVEENGTVAQMCPMPPKGDLIWVDGLLAVEDGAGKERMVAHYSKRKSLATQIEHGLVVFDDSTQRFRLLKKLDQDFTWQHPRGHPVRVSYPEGDYFVFGDVYYHIRVPAEWEAVQDPERYESFVRGPNGSSSFQWRKGEPPVTSRQERAWMDSGVLSDMDAWMQPKDVNSGQTIVLHRGSVRWNKHRQKYIMIANQIGGDSMLGEVWYGEAARPEGPWRKVVKVATHANYSYYNPVHREFFDQNDGRLIYFEGTYVTTFSGNDHPVPRYDYNQLMYRLDLDHPGLAEVR